GQQLRGWRLAPKCFVMVERPLLLLRQFFSRVWRRAEVPCSYPFAIWLSPFFELGLVAAGAKSSPRGRVFFWGARGPGSVLGCHLQEGGRHTTLAWDASQKPPAKPVMLKFFRRPARNDELPRGEIVYNPASKARRLKIEMANHSSQQITRLLLAWGNG